MIAPAADKLRSSTSSHSGSSIFIQVLRASHARLLLIVAVALLPFGCDAVYRTTQPVEVLVSEAHNQQPIQAAKIEAAAKYISEWNAGKPETERANLWMDSYREAIGTTNPGGQATLHMEIQTVQGGIVPGMFPGFDPHADRVTGQRYLFRITRDADTDLLSLEMQPGATASGENFALRVLSIGKSRLIK